MKKSSVLPVVLVLSASVLSGCVISVDENWKRDHNESWKKREYKNRKNIDQLHKGTGVDQVISHMGVADFNEFFEKNGQQYQVLYYRTHRRDGDGITTKDECTPLVFKSGELLGWGQSALTYL